MELSASTLRYLLAIYRLGLATPEVTPLAVANALGVTKPSVTCVMNALAKRGLVARRRYGKIYLTDRGVLAARYYAAVVEQAQRTLPPVEPDLTEAERYHAALALAAALPARPLQQKLAAVYGGM